VLTLKSQGGGEKGLLTKIVDKKWGEEDAQSSSGRNFAHGTSSGGGGIRRRRSHRKERKSIQTEGSGTAGLIKVGSGTQVEMKARGEEDEEKRSF